MERSNDKKEKQRRKGMKTGSSKCGANHAHFKIDLLGRKNKWACVELLGVLGTKTGFGHANKRACY